MKPPELNKNQYSVLIAEYSTGIIYKKDFTIYLNDEGEKEVYQAFNCFVDAVKYVQKFIVEKPDFEYLISDERGGYVCKIDKTTNFDDKKYFLEKIQKSIPGFTEGVKGCSFDEINIIEEELKVVLPLAYKEFLLLMGHEAGHILCGENYRYHELIGLQEEADDILYRRTGKHLPKDVFVFFIHQNYSFGFFYLYAGENPQVFLFVEPEEPAEIIPLEDSYSKFILKELDQFLDCRKQRLNSQELNDSLSRESQLKSVNLFSFKLLKRILYVIFIFVIYYFFFN